jgi:hypothetical protein
MSQENVEIMRRAYEAFNQRDLKEEEREENERLPGLIRRALDRGPTS